MLDGLKICKTVYRKTLDISNKRLDYALTQKMKNDMASPDKRGRITPNKTPEEKVRRVKDFLYLMPKYKSH